MATGLVLARLGCEFNGSLVFTLIPHKEVWSKLKGNPQVVVHQMAPSWEKDTAAMSGQALDQMWSVEQDTPEAEARNIWSLWLTYQG